MKASRDEEALRRSRLFSGASAESASYAFESGMLCATDYPKGREITFERGGLCILVKGKLKVGAGGDPKKLTVSQMEEGAVFGFASLYDGAERFRTDIRTLCATRVLFLPEPLISELIARDPAFARGVIAIQAEKIRFLNRRILSFTAPTGVKKLAGYLRTLPRDEDGCARLPVGMAPLAARLGVSRVSLYRAMNALEEEGMIRKEGDKIIFLSLSSSNSGSPAASREEMPGECRSSAPEKGKL